MRVKKKMLQRLMLEMITRLHLALIPFVGMMQHYSNIDHKTVCRKQRCGSGSGSTRIQVYLPVSGSGLKFPFHDNLNTPCGLKTEKNNMLEYCNKYQQMVST